MTNKDKHFLGEFERKVLRRIYGPLRVGVGEYRIRWNDELYELFSDMDIVRRIKIQRLRWLGHIAGMEENTPVRKIYDTIPPGGRLRTERPKLKWKDQVEVELAKLEIPNWRRRFVTPGCSAKLIIDLLD